ncbi:MAG: hypothetical protein JWN14_4268 [Chthonomonadales bacterium]|nr:hypothetical protein [Chthonomonadales bacterium]
MPSLRMLCATAGFLTLSTLGAVAKADVIDLTLQNNSQTFNVTFQKLNNDLITVSTLTHNSVRAGYFTAVLNSTPPSFTVYCVDIEGELKSPQTVTVVPVTVPGSSAHYDNTIGTFEDLTEAAWLMDNFDDLAGPNGVLADGSGINGAAMQAAIWNVIDGDADFDVTTGVFNISSDGNGNHNAIVAQANFYLAALQTALGLGGFNGQDPGTLYSAVDRTQNGQDVLRGRSSTTPEGASLLMFLPGLLPVAVGLRRRRNKSVGK